MILSPVVFVDETKSLTVKRCIYYNMLDSNTAYIYCNSTVKTAPSRIDKEKDDGKKDLQTMHNASRWQDHP